MSMGFDDLAIIILMSVILVVNLLTLIRIGGDRDAEAARLLDEKRSNRDYMDRLERAYSSSSKTNKEVIGILANLLAIAAPLTPLKSDDALKRFVDDVMTPGAETNGESPLETRQETQSDSANG